MKKENENNRKNSIKPNIKKTLVRMLLCMVIAVTAAVVVVPGEAEAAETIKNWSELSSEEKIDAKKNMPVTDIAPNKTIKVCLEKGERRYLSAKALKNETMTPKWKSSNKKVVTVDDSGNGCVLTAKKNGTATITASFSSISNISDRYTIKVTVHTHKWNNGKVTKKKSCTETGKKLYTCKASGGGTKIVKIPKHTNEYTKTVAASKKGQGYDVYTCTKCNHISKKNYVDWYPTEEEVYNSMIALKKKYKQGDRWDRNSSYHGIKACEGFARMLSDEAFGYLPFRELHDFTNIKVGDYIVTQEGENTHAAIILEIPTDEDYIVIAEGNVNESISWESTMRKASLKNPKYVLYVLTRYPE